ncbi:unnamed protein product [Merluccius merluccius]
MLRKALKVVTELHFRTVSCPGVHLWAKDDVYLSVCVMGQYRSSQCVPAVFPLLLQQKMTFEKVFRYAVDPGDIAVMLEYETVRIELVQLTPPVGETLAWFEEDSRHFLFPEPKLVPSYSGVGREVLMTRAPRFPGIAPRLEFWTKTSIAECSAVAETNVYPNVSMGPKPSKKRACKQRAVSPRRRLVTVGFGGGGGGTASDRGRHVAFQQGNHEETPRRLPEISCGSPAQRTLVWWPGASVSSSPPLRRSALSDGRPAPSKPSPPSLRSMSAGSIPSSSCESDTPIGQHRGASPSALWPSYRQQASSSRLCWSGPEDSWEAVQERVRALLTTPKAVRRLLFGATVSEVEEVLTRRSISPGLP